MNIATSCPCCHSTELNKSPAVLMPFVAHRVFDWQPVEITDEWSLRTIPNGNAYSICNTLHCLTCGLVFLDMRFNDEEMVRLYTGYRGKEYTALRDRYEPGYYERNERLLNDHSHVKEVEAFLGLHVKPEYILDYGGADGSNTPFQGKAEIDIMDIDPEISIRAYHQWYDLIVCQHVLEHSPCPAKVLEHIKKYMKDDSLLYIEVPLENLILNKQDYTCKKHWHEHINFFSFSSMQHLLDRCGLLVVDTNIMPVTEGAVYMLAVRRA